MSSNSNVKENPVLFELRSTIIDIAKLPYQKREDLYVVRDKRLSTYISVKDYVKLSLDVGLEVEVEQDKLAVSLRLPDHHLSIRVSEETVVTEKIMRVELMDMVRNRFDKLRKILKSGSKLAKPENWMKALLNAANLSEEVRHSEEFKISMACLALCQQQGVPKSTEFEAQLSEIYTAEAQKKLLDEH